MKKINFSQLFPSNPNRGDGDDRGVLGKIADFIVIICPGLLVLTVGIGILELCPAMTQISDFLRRLAYLLVVWCSVATVILAAKLQRWLPALMSTTVILIVFYLCVMK